MASSAPLMHAGDMFDRVATLAAASVAVLRAECAAFAYCDAEGRLLGMRHTGCGLTDMVDVPVRRIAIDALALDCAVVVMAHNHPSGHAWPSRADRDATRRIAVALNALGVRLHDHVIVAGPSRWSFRDAGLL